jgi:pectate lyase-like protein
MPVQMSQAGGSGGGGGTVVSCPIYFNVKCAPYNAKGDGVTDDTAAIAAAATAASAARVFNGPNGSISQGATLFFPAGTYIVSNLPAYTGIRYLGECGTAAALTTIMLKSGTNADLFSYNVGAINLSQTYGTGSVDALSNFTFQDIHLHGNRAGQTSGPSYVMRMYARGYKFENVYISDGFTGGILADYGNVFPQNHGPNGSDGILEYHWSNVNVFFNDGIGVEIGGPSDGQMVNCEFAESGSHNMHLGPNCTGLQAVNSHWWFPGQGNNSVNCLCEGAAGFTGCEFEGSDTMNFALFAFETSITGGAIFAGGHNGGGIQIGQSGGRANPYANSLYQSGGLTTYATVNSYRLDTYVHDIGDLTHGGIWWDHDGLGGQVIANVSGTAVPWTGVPLPTTQILLMGDDGSGHETFFSQNVAGVAPLSIAGDNVDTGFAGATTNALASNVWYLKPFTLQLGVTLHAFRANCGVASTGNIFFNIVADSSGVPGATQFNSGTAFAGGSPTAGSHDYTCTSDTYLPPGKYWMCVGFDNTTDTIYTQTLLDSSLGGCYTCPKSGGSFATFTKTTVRPVFIGLVTNGWA